jgi:predicted  nucleic acid-binding Zn-ribbon protein
MSSLHEWQEELKLPAEQVLKKDLIKLRNYSASRQRDLFNTLQQNKEEYEWDLVPEHNDVLADQTQENDLAMFEAAQLLLAAAMDMDPDSDAAAEGFIDQFERDELEFVKEFDDYRRKFGEIDDSQLERNIKNKEGQVYEFVTEVIDPQADLNRELLDTSSNNIRGGAISYFQHELDEFFDLANEAVYLYIKHHGLPNTVEGIVDAAEAAEEASAERERIAATLREELQSLSETIHHSLRDQEQALRAEMSRLEADLETGGADESVRNELDAIKSELSTLSNQRSSDVQAIERKLDSVTELENDLNEQIKELKDTQQHTREQLQEQSDEQSQAQSLLADELDRLAEQKETLQNEIQQLQTEREQMTAAGERLDREFDTLTERVDETEQRIDTEVDNLEGRIDEVRESLRDERDSPKGKAIRAEIARLYEMDYIGRFETSVAETDTLTLPDGEQFTVPEGFWDDRQRHFTGNHRSVVAEALDGGNPDRYPVGRYSVYRVRTSKMVAFSETKLVIEAVVAANLEAFATNGFDARPAGIDDLLDIVNETRTRAESNDTTHVIGVASPTGWTDEVKQLVREDDARTTYGKQVRVCLVDIQSNELIYDHDDQLVADNAHLFDRKIDRERVSDCVETLRSEYVTDPMTELIRQHEVVQDHDYDPYIVSSAFEQLADDGAGVTGYPATADGLCLILD